MKVEGVDVEEAGVDVEKDDCTPFKVRFYVFNSCSWVIAHGFPINSAALSSNCHPPHLIRVVV